MSFAVRKRFSEAVNMKLIIQNGLKAPQTVLCEYKEHITVGEIEMRTAITLPDIALVCLAQNP